MQVMHLSRILLPKQWDKQGQLFFFLVYTRTYTERTEPRKTIYFIEYMHAKEYDSCKTIGFLVYIYIQKLQSEENHSLQLFYFVLVTQEAGC